VEHIIEVRNLTKVYRDGDEEVRALDDVSFNLKFGDDLLVLGPSGSGKTTLLELLAGLNEPTSGEVTIDGRNVHDGSDEEISAFRNQTIGFVFQMMHLQNYFTAMENVTLPLIAKGVKRDEARKRAVELLKQFGLEERMSHYPKQLSGGEMQRVAVARALANTPKIIFADEPTGKLDRKNADRILDIFSDISKMSGVSVIMITHDESMKKRFKNVIELEHGKVKRRN
jgi:ABC-type lipoprotein export system ATPase subunit